MVEWASIIYYLSFCLLVLLLLFLFFKALPPPKKKKEQKKEQKWHISLTKSVNGKSTGVLSWQICWISGCMFNFQLQFIFLQKMCTLSGLHCWMYKSFIRGGGTGRGWGRGREARERGLGCWGGEGTLRVFTKSYLKADISCVQCLPDHRVNVFLVQIPCNGWDDSPQSGKRNNSTFIVLWHMIMMKYNICIPSQWKVALASNQINARLNKLKSQE